jgi:hypothetical protein
LHKWHIVGTGNGFLTLAVAFLLGFDGVLISTFASIAQRMPNPVQINFNQQIGCVSALNPAMQVQAAAFIC